MPKMGFHWILLLSNVLGMTTVSAQEWPQWRGPNRDGVLTGFAAPATWPQELTRVWKSPVGGGYSSPIVSGSRIYVHTQQEGKEVISSIDMKSGKTLWSQSYPADFNKNRYAREMDKGPYSTPLVHDGSLYTLGTTGILSSFDARTGDLKWRKDFSEYADTSRLFCGTAMSPLVDRGLLMVHVGDDRTGWVIGFDANTGSERWRWKGDGPGYASPIVADLEGERQFITLTDKSVIGISVEDGRLLWSFSHADEWNENIVTPVLDGNRLIISGVRQGTRAIELKKNGEAWAPTQLWHNSKIRMYMSSPVLSGGFLYGLSSLRKGQFFCLDIRNGEARWTTLGREAENASILASQEFLFLLTDEGRLIVAAKSPEGFSPLARYTVADGPTWAHPVLWKGGILVKDSTSISLWRLD